MIIIELIQAKLIDKINIVTINYNSVIRSAILVLKWLVEESIKTCKIMNFLSAERTLSIFMNLRFGVIKNLEWFQKEFTLWILYAGNRRIINKWLAGGSIQKRSEKNWNSYNCGESEWVKRKYLCIMKKV